MKTVQGFTLIEVLITLIVLAIGLLGMAGMQTYGLRNNVSAYNRGQATQLVYDMIDRMRSNAGHANLNAASTYTTIEPGDASKQESCVQIDDICTSAQMAQNDLYQWNDAITETLPSGAVGVITFADPAYIITVNWVEGNEASSFNASFIL